MPHVTVIIPTLVAGSPLAACVQAVAAQSYRDFEVIVVDNSGCGRAASSLPGQHGHRILSPKGNVGFAAAMNLGIAASRGRFVASLNDDAEPEPGWLGALVDAAAANSRVGMCASQILLYGTELLDSAGMLICFDGVAKQRGHGLRAERFPQEEDVLFPSACAALYRRAMLDQIGVFDEELFLYCEDSDLGLRARRAGWTCRYAPRARVHHHYSKSAGRASGLKAWYIERNRLRIAIRNFPPEALVRVPFVSLSRYFWSFVFAFRPESPVFEFRKQNSSLSGVVLILRAHWAALIALPALLRQRAIISRTAAVSTSEFLRLLKSHSIAPRQVSELL